MERVITAQEHRSLLHDLKNYVYMLDSALTLLRQALLSGDKESAETLVDAAEHSAERLRQIVTSGHEKKDRVSVVDVLLEVIDEFKSREAVLSCNCLGESPFVFAKRTDLIRVFQNILKNAFEAMESVPVKKVEASISERGGTVTISIINNGPSFPGGSDGAEIIFREGFSTKSSGRGIGLDTVRRLLKENGGSIKARNCLGGGVEFILEMPKAEVTAPPAVTSDG